MPLLDSALYIFAAFIFGVIFGIFVKGITRVIFSIILAVLFLMILISFFDGGIVSSIIATLIGFGILIFTFLLRRINSFPKAVK